MTEYVVDQRLVTKVGGCKSRRKVFSVQFVSVQPVKEVDGSNRHRSKNAIFNFSISVKLFSLALKRISVWFDIFEFSES